MCLILVDLSLSLSIYTHIHKCIYIVFFLLLCPILLDCCPTLASTAFCNLLHWKIGFLFGCRSASPRDRRESQERAYSRPSRERSYSRSPPNNGSRSRSQSPAARAPSRSQSRSQSPNHGEYSRRPNHEEYSRQPNGDRSPSQWAT